MSAAARATASSVRPPVAAAWLVGDRCRSRRFRHVRHTRRGPTPPSSSPKRSCCSWRMSRDCMPQQASRSRTCSICSATRRSTPRATGTTPAPNPCARFRATSSGSTTRRSGKPRFPSSGSTPRGNALEPVARARDGPARTRESATTRPTWRRRWACPKASSAPCCPPASSRIQPTQVERRGDDGGLDRRGQCCRQSGRGRTRRAIRPGRRFSVLVEHSEDDADVRGGVRRGARRIQSDRDRRRDARAQPRSATRRTSRYLRTAVAATAGANPTLWIDDPRPDVRAGR